MRAAHKIFLVTGAAVFIQTGVIATLVFWDCQPTEPVAEPVTTVYGADHGGPASDATADLKPAETVDSASTLPAAPGESGGGLDRSLEVVESGLDDPVEALPELIEAEDAAASFTLLAAYTSQQGTADLIGPASEALLSASPIDSSEPIVIPVGGASGTSASSSGAAFSSVGASGGGGGGGGGAGSVSSVGRSVPTVSSGHSSARTSSSSGSSNTEPFGGGITYPPFVAMSTYPGNFSRDVENVWAAGDSTLSGMEIVQDHFTDGAFLVVTTGARYEYAPGRLDIYQGLGTVKRHLATVLLSLVHDEDDQPPPEPIRFEKVTATKDHALYWSEAVNIGIYGDSTCLIGPKQPLQVSFRGHFRPDYNGRYLGELLLIDDLGGMEIYPQRYEAGYRVKKIELEREDWQAEYVLQPNQRAMLAAFPGKPFDWDYYFNSEMLATYGSLGKGVGNPYGQMPPDERIEEWSKQFQILFLAERGIYVNENEPSGPYRVANPTEFRRLMRTAKRWGLKVVPYTSPFYHVLRYNTLTQYFEQVCDLVNEYAIDGVYLDGLPFGYGARRLDNKIAAWECIRRLRSLFGTDGVLVYHGTHKDGPSMRGLQTAAIPNIGAYCNIVLMGEGIPVHSLDDDYLNYQVRQYGISNSIGIWLSGSRDTSRITRQQVTNKMLEIFGHELAWASAPVLSASLQAYPRWGSGMTPYYTYYKTQLEKLRRDYTNHAGLWGPE